MSLTNIERETIVVFNEGEQIAEIFTYNARIKRRLQELCPLHPADVRQIKDNGEGGVTYQCPKSWIRINPPRTSINLTEEQREQRRENMRKLHKARLQS